MANFPPACGGMGHSPPQLQLRGWAACDHADLPGSSTTTKINPSAAGWALQPRQTLRAGRIPSPHRLQPLNTETSGLVT